MSNLKTLRTRLKTIKTTQKITKAMQLVAASKLKKVKPSIKPAKAYFENVKDALYQTLESARFNDLDSTLAKFIGSSALPSNHLLLILYASQKGLCGSFNMMIIKKFLEDVNNFKKQNKKLTIIVVGKRGYDALKSKSALEVAYYDSELGSLEDFTNFRIYQQILKLTSEQNFDQCYLYFNIFKNPLVQVPTKFQLFPISYSPSESTKSASSKFEIEGENILNVMIEHFIKANLRYAHINTVTGEEGARMNAMDNANRNAEKINNLLTLKLNRSRQEIITRELIEIISGAEALSN